MTRRAPSFSPTKIAEAARIATESGAVIELVSPDGRVIRVAPVSPARQHRDAIEEWFDAGEIERRS